MPTLLEWLTAGGGGAAIMKTADLAATQMFGRKSREVKALGETVEILAKQQERFDESLKACHASHEACESGRREDRKKIDELEAEVRRFLNGDSSGPVAAYHPKGKR